MSVTMLAGDHCAKLTTAGAIVGMSYTDCMSPATVLPNLCISQCETPRCPERDLSWMGDIAVIEQTPNLNNSYSRGTNVT